jgi:hypothetical protein
MTGSLRRSLITSKPRSHPATDGPASSGGDGGSGAVGWALLYRGLSRGLSQDARSRRRWAHPGCLLPTSGQGWQPGTALEQSPQHPKAGSGPAYGQRPDDGDESSRRPRLGFHAALVVPVRGVPGVGCGAFAVHWRPGWLPTSPARGVRGRAAAGRAAGRHAHPRRAAARRDAAGWACHLVGARPAALAARTLRPARAHRAHPSPGSVCGPDGPIPPARSAHDGPSGRLRLVGSPPSRWPGHPTRAGRAWRLDRSARPYRFPVCGPGRPADSSDSPSASLRQLGSPTGGYSRDRSHGASPGPTLPGSRSPTIQGPQWPRERR